MRNQGKSEQPRFKMMRNEENRNSIKEQNCLSCCVQMRSTNTENKPVNSERMALMLNISAGLAKVIPNDMPDIP